MKKNNSHQFVDVDTVKIEKGINSKVIRKISALKNEDKEMYQLRLDAYELFKKLPQPSFGPSLEQINFDDFIYYATTNDDVKKNWDEIPVKIKQTFAKLGIQEAEAKHLSGVMSQFDSTAVYSNQLKKLEEQGVIFLDTDTAYQKHPELFKKYFAKLVKPGDNLFAALNSAVWSGGTFIYIPKGLKLVKPLQSYFRINSQNLGQFERTLIIVDEGAQVEYIEGCTAPLYSSDLLHAAVVEIFVEKDAKCRYTTVQNWSDNVYNLVTKRAICGQNAQMEWIDGNIGSKVTMKYPSVILHGDYSSASTISIAYASENQIQDTGCKMIHIGKNTSSTVIAKSFAKKGGKVNYRGIIKHAPSATNAKSNIECDTLLYDEQSSSDTIPYNFVNNGTSMIQHEAKVSKISQQQLFYLMSRGLNETQATDLIINGFMEPFTKELPLEYAIELNELISMGMEDSLG
jgi:Fe-S cluster assembly protein SufB